MKKEITSLKDVREYVGEKYWEKGLSEKCSGYENASIDWWWNLRWLQCWNQIFPSRDKVVLDLGCGLGGFVAALLTAAGADAHGIDISEYAINKGHQLYEPITQRTSVGSIHDLSMFPDNRVDYIYSMQVFEHLPEDLTDTMIAEMSRVLKLGGQVWAALVLGNGRSADDNDLSHINIHPREWWDEKCVAQGLVPDQDADRRLRNTTAGPDNPGYSYFKDFGWHSICYRKIHV